MRDGTATRATTTGRAVTALWTAGVTVVLAGMPLLARDRLPDRLATHWGLDGEVPDGSMPLWAASLFPALIWLVTAAAVIVPLLRAGPAAHPWTTVVLLPMGIVLTGAQAAVIRSNLDRADWHEARQPTGWVVAILVAAVLAGVAGWLLVSRRRGTPDDTATPDEGAPALDIPKGRRLVWFSRSANPWLQLLAAGTGLVAVGALVALVGGLAAPGGLWSLFTGCAVASVACAIFSSVQARVSERGLEVSFGPLGWPGRRWAPGDIETARMEVRRPAEVGGWGYRFSGLGTTVMLRAGECLVVRPRGRRSDFAVSVDDAERGAALLNALRTNGKRG
ncbi:DUF1648 domain-containing protein [Streptomyces ardesiacus]|uniref:DUF1648 domain-containing protein n=1 Tax=unclassified Streptomyces TaxID=2593676 RepID=UPI0004C58CDC|nr:MULTISPECIES: DUF1648 domain-containing protein [unclassified Streptomyces]KOX47070.1 hypothetical protein ADL09_15870 [Streptomyces sp. NRRL F-7442]